VSERSVWKPAAEPISERVGDVVFEDPFRHLEDESPDVRSWERRLDAAACRSLRSHPGYRTLVERLDRHLGACSTPPPRRGGRKWFSSRFDNGRLQRIDVGNGPEGQRRTLVDVRDLVHGANPSIDYFVPSPSGSLIAVGVSVSGDEQSRLHLVDGNTGRSADGPLAIVTGGRLAWLPDSSGLYCVVSPGGERASVLNELAFVRPGESVQTIEVPRRCGERRLVVQVSGDGRYLGVGSDPVAPRLLCVLDRRESRWHVGVTAEPGLVFWGVFVGDRYVAVTTIGASRGRLVSARVDRIHETAAWDAVQPETDAVLRSVALVGERLALFEFRDGIARIRMATAGGRTTAEVPLERPGLVMVNPRNPGQYGADPPAVIDSEGLTFGYATVDRAPALLRYEPDTGRLSCLAPSGCGVDDVVTRHRWCRSGDGDPVDYRLVRRGTVDGGSGPRPTVIVAYGGWNAMTASAGYLGPLAPFVEDGGTVAFANVRGDATHGADRWLGGRRASKQRAFDDVYAVAEDLIERRDAVPEMLGLVGGSNGGLLVAVALTQRPELFRAVVALVPLLDMGRMLRERYVEIGIGEYGDPRIASEAAWLRAYSPYHNVRRSGTHPATLFVCGAQDVRCHPWHARKMVAALHDRQPAAPPVMLRVHADCGHLSAGPLATSQVVAEWLGFLMRELGLDDDGGDDAADRKRRRGEVRGA
jgi:prolyl oligopeptidase